MTDTQNVTDIPISKIELIKELNSTRAVIDMFTATHKYQFFGSYKVIHGFRWKPNSNLHLLESSVHVDQAPHDVLYKLFIVGLQGGLFLPTSSLLPTEIKPVSSGMWTSTLTQLTGRGVEYLIVDDKIKGKFVNGKMEEVKTKKLKVGKRSGLKYFGLEDLHSWRPCYDPSKYLSEDWRGTAIDVLKNDKVPFADRLWAVLRTELVSEKVMRLFAVWSYRQTLKFVNNPDPRSIKAAEVAEAFALGNVTKEELSAIWSDAKSAESAAWSAWSDARSVEYYSAWYSAISAESAARSAAESAAYYSAWSAARSDGRFADCYSAQKDKLIEMILIDAKQTKRSK